MRLAYLGSPEVAVGPLRALVEAGHDIAVVVTQPDRRRGRGSALVPTPVKVAALELGLPVSDRVDDVVAVGVELGIVVAFGRIIRPEVLSAVPMLNLHFSLLPRWRGAAPVERAILAGDEVTGVAVMEVAEGLDTGAVYDCEELLIGSDQTAEDLRSQLAEIGTRLLVRLLADNLPEPESQVGTPTYAKKLVPADHCLDWMDSALQLHRVVRVGSAWTTFRGRRLRVLATAVGDRDTTLNAGEIDPVT
ncbi:MAG: methionyl-tRNA formyltransferase, partial [Pseudonocardiaceae bacterium]